MSNLYLNLTKVQGELNAPKNQTNDFGGYQYRSCEDILQAAKPLCIANGLMLSLTDEIIFIEGRHYVESTAMVINIEDGKAHFTKAQARETENKKGMDSAQITGSASSYARKYALNGLFCIDDTKDPDTQPPPDKPQNNYSNNSNTEWTKETKFTFGKYKGKTTNEVYKENPSYFKYLSENSSDESLKVYAKKIYEYHESKVEQETGDMFDGQHGNK